MLWGAASIRAHIYITVQVRLCPAFQYTAQIFERRKNAHLAASLSLHGLSPQLSRPEAEERKGPGSHPDLVSPASVTGRRGRKWQVHKAKGLSDGETRVRATQECPGVDMTRCSFLESSLASPSFRAQTDRAVTSGAAR